MRIEADLDRCIGAGMCVLTAPALFDQDPADGHVLLRAEGPEPDQLTLVEQAVALCPSGALSLRA